MCKLTFLFARFLRHRNLFFNCLSLLTALSLFLIISEREVFAECSQSEEWIRKGILEIHTGDARKAVALFEKTTRKCRKRYKIAYNLAIAYGMTGKYHEMTRVLIKALSRKKDFYLGKVNLAWSLMHEGKYQKAREIIKSLESRDRSSVVLLLKAFSYLYQNNRSDFNKIRKQAIATGLERRKSFLIYLNQIKDESEKTRFTSERLPAIYIDFGRFYEKIGDFEKATEFYLSSKKRAGLIRLISLLKTTQGSKTEIEEYKNSLIDWTGAILPDLERALNYNVSGAFPEGVLTFIYPENMVEVPEGSFQIGRPGVSRSDKNHFWKHEVFTSSFFIGKYEVSNIEYLIFINSTGYPSPYNTHNSNYDLWVGGSVKASIAYQPVVNVSWYDVNRYLGWKSLVTEERYRLPTEERWEKAARGLDGRLYPWGNKEPSRELANYGKNWNDFEKKYTTLKDVDSYKKGRSPFNIYNMAGNVWEWTSSIHNSFFYDDPTLEVEKSDVTRNELKVIRGGSWINKPGELASTWRNRNWPYIKYNGIGFRVMKDL